MADQTAGKDSNRGSFLNIFMDALHDRGESCCSVSHIHNGSELLKLSASIRDVELRQLQNVCGMMQLSWPVLLNCNGPC